MSRALKLLGQALALTLVVGMLGLLVWRLTQASHAPKIGGRAPAFSLKRLGEHSSVGLASLRGKVVVLNFWASWCPPCKSEAGALETAYRQYRKLGVVFLGIDYNDVSSDARTFLRHHGVTYPTLEDGSGAVGDRYGLSGVPETFFVNRQGRLVGFHIMGPITNPTFRAEFTQGVAAALRP